MIDLLQLGNGSMQPLPGRWLSSFLIRYRADLILFDCGEGTQIVARKFSWGFKRISAICISHHHADHIAGLPGILMCIANAGRTEPVTIYGPRDTTEIVQALLVICPQFAFDLKIVEFHGQGETDVFGPLRLRVIEVHQRGLPVLAWRFDLDRWRRFDRDAAERDEIPKAYWSQLQSGVDVAYNGTTILAERYLQPPRHGLSFGFVTDTRPGPHLVEAMRGVDLLVCEATYLDDSDIEKAMLVDHIVLSEACALADDAGAGRLLLTHFSGAYADPGAFQPKARSMFPGAEIGYTGWTTTLSFPRT